MLAYNKLRYRLMPYIYSLAGQAWLNDYTIMRGLTMDFSLDTAVFDIADQYMFGPSLMVNPVTGPDHSLFFDVIDFGTSDEYP